MLPDYTGRPVEDFTRDEFINFIGGDCYGDPMKFSGLRCQFLINEQVTPCIKVFADPAWNLDGSLHDFGYCAHIPEEELMSFLVGLGYTITFVEPPVGEKTAWAPLNPDDARSVQPRRAGRRAGPLPQDQRQVALQGAR
jgi:hypothetical protein